MKKYILLLFFLLFSCSFTFAQTVTVNRIIQPLPAGTNNIGNITLSGLASDDTTNSTAKVPIIAARANAASPVWTENYQVPLSTDLSGNLRVNLMAGDDVTANQGVANATPWNENVAQINGVTPLMGNGVTGAGSPRVTISSDNTPFSVKIDQTTPGTTNRVDVGAALPAGANNIGDVDVLTLPSLPAGINNIGDVDVVTLPSLPAGANTIGTVNVGTFPDNEPVNIGQYGGVAVGAGNAVHVQPGTGANFKVNIDQTTPGITNRVDIGAALPAGNNNIGDVDVLTLPSIPAGANNIGDVDVLTLPSIPAGANTIGTVNVGTFPANQPVNINNTTKTIARASISIAVIGDNTIIAAPGAGVSIKIVSLTIYNNVTTSQTAILKDGAAVINGAGFALGGTTGYGWDAPGGIFPMVLTANTAFIINLSAATNVSGFCLYYQE